MLSTPHLHARKTHVVLTIALLKGIIYVKAQKGPKKANYEGPALSRSLQGDHSGCSMGFVDIKTKGCICRLYGPFTKTQPLFSCNLNGHPVVAQDARCFVRQYSR